MRGWPLDLSSDPRREAPFEAIPFAGAVGAGCSFPFTAVNLDVGESFWAVALCSSGVVAISKAADAFSDWIGAPSMLLLPKISLAKFTRSRLPEGLRCLVVVALPISLPEKRRFS